MSARFTISPTDDGGRIRLVERKLIGQRLVPVEQWNNQSDPADLAAIRLLRRLVDEGLAQADSTSIWLPTEQLAQLPLQVASHVGMPEVASLSVELSLRGLVHAPDGRIGLRWTDGNGREISPVFRGLFVKFGDTEGRLTDTLHRLVRSIAGYNDTAGEDERVAAWLPVQHAIELVIGEAVQIDGFLQSFRIYQAGAFALDVRQTTDGPQFEPVLMSPGMRRSGDEDDAPARDLGADPDSELADAEARALLPPVLRRPFAESFAAGGQTRSSYVLQRQTYLVIDPDLRTALDTLKAVKGADAETRRNFLRNPRSYLAEAMPGADAGAIGSMFVETRQYSDRVQGLGLWEKPKLEWLVRKGTGWLPERFTVRVGNQDLVLDESTLGNLAELLEQARQRQSDTLEFAGATLRTADVAEMIARLKVADTPPPSAEPAEATTPAAQVKSAREVLILTENIEETGYARSGGRRPHSTQKLFPSDHVRTQPKPHQIEGFGWLVDAWIGGLPGVLLADDMGLGKTMQALAFLAWFRENRKASGARAEGFTGPILVVAPTALLRNWQKEAATHLNPNVLGRCIEIFGAGLSALKNRSASSPENAIDLDALGSAGWVLTTYETLATYHRAFARIAFPVVIFDEMQKIKAPDTINTHAAKAMNADFVLGMTGTPIENRIEDLWCLMDRVAPGRFGALKAFSATYGSNDEKALNQLKDRLSGGEDERPPLMLRRMKEDHLEGLPNRQIRHYRSVEMPDVQASAYAGVVARARSGDLTKGEMLRVVHELRGISLHPQGGDSAGQLIDWIARSARVSQAVAVLDEIRNAGEKALVFIEDRDVQSAFAAAVAERYALLAEPAIINGSVPGERRQEIVDRFQAAPPGFALLILSPKAAGMGLTITAANHVIHLSRWWNPAVEDQCNDRVYRIGQTRPVTVHIPMSVHPDFGDASFDLRLDYLLGQKRDLARHMLVSPVSDSDADTLFRDAVHSGRSQD